MVNCFLKKYVISEYWKRVAMCENKLPLTTIIGDLGLEIAGYCLRSVLLRTIVCTQGQQAVEQ